MFRNKCDLRAVQRIAFCRSRLELSKAYLLAKIGFNTAENEPFKLEVSQVAAHRVPRWLRICLRECRPARSARSIADRTLQGSFSAVSKPNFARKYAFESSHRDLHNALLCTALQSQNFVKIAKLFVKVAKFSKLAIFLKISQNFGKILAFLKKKRDFRAVQRSALCRSRRELSNAYLLAKFGCDTAENEPFKVR